MAANCKLVFVLGVAVCSFAVAACAQDAPSLGDLARQQREAREAEQAKQAQTPKVVTNEEIPEHHVPDAVIANARAERGSSTPEPTKISKQSAQAWKSQIQTQKAKIASLQSHMDQVNQSIHFVSHECASARCVQRNERQVEKQQQVERMQAQLDGQKKRLEEMQDSARRQGYGNSVYDPAP